MEDSDIRKRSGDGEFEVRTRCSKTWVPWDGIATSYTLTRKLGEGSYGCVCEAKSKTGTASVCALKRMSMSRSENAPKKALREVGILRRLSHPNVIRLQRAFFANDDRTCTELYLVFDHGGIDLHKYLRERPAGPNRSQPEVSALNLTKQLCRGVAFLHSGSVIHRDLKPSNLMVSMHPACSTLAFFLAPPCLGAMGSILI